MATLSASITADDWLAHVSGDTSDAVRGALYRIDEEIIRFVHFESFPVVSGSLGRGEDPSRWRIRRGVAGTTKASHDSGATIYAVTSAVETGTTLTPPDPFPDAGAPAAHAASHEDGGADEIDVTGLVGAGGSDALTDPTDIDGCALWLDASQLELADNAPVATWPDLSGEGNDATQAAGVNAEWNLATNFSTSGTFTLSVDDGEGPVAVGPLNWNDDATAVQAAFTTAGITTTCTVGPLDADVVHVEFTGAFGAKPITVAVTADTLDAGPAEANESVAGHGVSPDYTANLPVCKTNVLNGLRVVRFDASGAPVLQYLRLTGGGLDLFRNLDGFTVAAVWAAIPGTDDYLLNASSGSDAATRRVRLEPIYNDQAIQFGATNDDSVDANGAVNDIAGTGVGAKAIAWVGAVDFVGGGVVAEASGTSFANDAPTFSDTPGPSADTASLAINIGATPDLTGGLTGDIAELVVYQRALNARERRLLMEYLSAKWAVL